MKIGFVMIHVLKYWTVHLGYLATRGTHFLRRKYGDPSRTLNGCHGQQLWPTSIYMLVFCKLCHVYGDPSRCSVVQLGVSPTPDLPVPN